MNAHRELWKPIIANILIALIGIGLLAIIVKFNVDAISSNKLSWGSSLFFAKTNSQNRVEDIEASLSL